MADTGVFPSDARAIHDALKAEDKTLEFMAGDHYLTDDGARRGIAHRLACTRARYAANDRCRDPVAAPRCTDRGDQRLGDTGLAQIIAARIAARRIEQAKAGRNV